jgi:asparagine synthase (glutamine-hydrolysing)
MCGIAGIIDLKSRRAVPTAALKRANDALYHRGPDEEGYLQRLGLGFAARRLSIVGVADGYQPSFNEDRKVSVVFNGEIYDYAEWATKLRARGHVLKTKCDTELLPHLWEEYEAGMFERLNGQFAIALYDEPKQKIVLARDRFGICPLYWARVNKFGTDWLVFGSEVKALLATGLIEPKPERRGIDTVFNFLAVPGPQSCFEGINILPPGRFLMISRGRPGEDAEITERTYWNMEFPEAGREERGRPEQSVVTEFEAILYDAVKRRLRADVPVASYLSGGVDSSIVVAMARDVLGHTPSTFTVKILDPKLDETAEASAVARHLKAHPSVVACGSKDIVAGYQRLLVATEAPVTDTSCTALLMLARRVHEEGFKVTLTGEGSDEWLAGYPWYKFHALLEGFKKIAGQRAHDRVRQYFYQRHLRYSDGALDYLDQSIEASGGPHAFDKFYGLLKGSRHRLYSAGMLRDLETHDPYAALDPDIDRTRNWDPVNRAIFWAGKIHLPGHLLSLKGDRLAMSQSVEMRYPFLDNNVFDFLAKTDPGLKIRGLREKYLLRRVAERWLPKRVAWRPKGMFRAPLDGFFLQQRLPYVDELLSEESLKKSGYFDPQVVTLWRTKYRELSSRFYQRSSMELGLVAVLATQLWHHTFIDPSLASLPDWRTLAGVEKDPRDLGFAEQMPESAAV